MSAYLVVFTRTRRNHAWGMLLSATISNQNSCFLCVFHWPMVSTMRKDFFFFSFKGNLSLWHSHVRIFLILKWWDGTKCHLVQPLGYIWCWPKEIRLSKAHKSPSVMGLSVRTTYRTVIKQNLFSSSSYLLAFPPVHTNTEALSPPQGSSRAVAEGCLNGVRDCSQVCSWWKLPS